jgi:hypothetical protein
MPFALGVVFRGSLRLGWSVVLLAASITAGAEPRNGPNTAAGPRSLPQVGDTWTYRLTLLRDGRAPTESRVVVRVTSASLDTIVDEVSRDGGAPFQWAHSAGNYMVPQVVSVFSPYLAAFQELQPGSRIWRVIEHDDVCYVWVNCSTVGRIEGREIIQIPAGRFDTIKVVLEHTKLKRQGPAHLGGFKSSTTIVWYSPQAKRAVKVTSRLSRSQGDGYNGSRSPFHATFDLELVSYQVQSAASPADSAAPRSDP